MKEHDLKKLFKETEQSAIRKEAKQQAIDASMAEFREATQTETTAEKKNNGFQGLRRLFRLTSEKTHSRSKTMTTNNRLVYSGLFASACLVVLGVFVALLYKQQSFNPLSITEKTAEPKIVAEREWLQDRESRADAQLEEIVVTSQIRSEEQLASIPATKARQESFDMALAAPNYQVAAAEANRPIVMGRAIAPSDDNTAAPYYQEQGRDRFESVETNPIKLTKEEPVSTFSIDVDTASYSFVRRQLNQGLLPQKDAVRLEEMLNYFDYDYPLPKSKDKPFTLSIAVDDSPWAKGNKLVHIGIKGYEISRDSMPRSNLVFLLDVSGSMNSPDKLPLVKQSMGLLLNQLQPEDTIGIVVYAGAAGTVLEPTPVKEKQKILNALNQLSAGGSTAGAQGIKLAYQLAESNYDKQAVNRIVLATDGDFNVGITNREELKGFVERKREQGIFLSVLGFGQGNYHDHMMQVLAQNGNGVAAYIDTLSEAQKVLVDQASSTLFTIAKDVKIQVEFNPSTVSEYRLLGYETRHLNREDFNNDSVDAGDIGAGHTVTAIYEITPTDANSGLIDDSRYAAAPEVGDTKANEYGFIKIRYKLPEADKSKLISEDIPATNTAVNQETKFATAVSGFAQVLEGGRYTGNWSYDEAIELAQKNKGEDPYGYRTEFIQLIRKAKVAAGM